MMLSKSRGSLTKACGATLSSCLVASSLVILPALGSRPPTAPPAVHLTASASPLTVDLPALIAQVEEFAALVDPVIGAGAAPTATTDLATATSGGPGSIGIEIANALAWLPGLLFRAMADGTLSPLLTTPVIGPLIGNIVFFTSAAGLGLAYVVGNIVMAIERAVWSAVDAVGGLVGGLFRLPTATLSGAAAADTPGPDLRTARAATDDVPTVIETDPAVQDSALVSASSSTEDEDVVEPVATDTIDTVADSEPAEVTEPDESESISEPVETLSDDETSTEGDDLTTDLPSAQAQNQDEPEADEDQTPGSPSSADSDPADDADDPQLN